MYKIGEIFELEERGHLSPNSRLNPANPLTSRPYDFLDTQPPLHVTRNRSKSELVFLCWPSSATLESYFWYTATCSCHSTSSTCSTSTALETFSSTSGSTRSFESLFCASSDLHIRSQQNTWDGVELEKLDLTNRKQAYCWENRRISVVYERIFANFSYLWIFGLCLIAPVGAINFKVVRAINAFTEHQF